MRPRQSALRVVFGALVLALPGPPARADDVEKLLRRPISPGAIAALAVHAGKPGVAERLQAGLESADPRVRGAAARVANVGALADVLPAVEKALAAESDPDAATEEIRTLVSVGGPSFDAAILEARRRLAPRLDSPVLFILARARGMASVPVYFDVIRGSKISANTLQSFFEIATRQQRDALLAAAALAFSRHDTAAWQAILGAAGRLPVPLDAPLFDVALRSQQETFRGEAAWYLARAYCGQPPARAAEILLALSEGGPPAGTETDPELHFGSELLRRVLGSPAVEDEAWIACLETNTKCHLDSGFEQSPARRVPDPPRTRGHRAAQRRRSAAGCEGEPDETRRSASRNPAAPGFGHSQRGRREPARRRGLPVEPDALVQPRVGLLRHGWGSPPGRDAHGAPRGLVSAHRGNDVSHVAGPGEHSRPGARAARLPRALRPEGPRLRRAAARGRGSRRRRRRARARDGDRAEARQEGGAGLSQTSRKAGEQGVSIYEAIVSQTGCVEDLRLIKSSAPVLDIMGMEAISQWQYEPARLDGRPVSVFLTVTVTFRLNG